MRHVNESWRPGLGLGSRKPRRKLPMTGACKTCQSELVPLKFPLQLFRSFVADTEWGRAQSVFSSSCSFREPVGPIVYVRT